MVYLYNRKCSITTQLSIKKNEVSISCYNTETSKIVCKIKEFGYKRPLIEWFHLHEMFRIGKSMETKSRLVVAGG